MNKKISERKHWDDFWKRDRDLSEIYDNDGRIPEEVLKCMDVRDAVVMEVGAATARDSVILAEKGAIIATRDTRIAIDAFPADLKDATGAGDTFDGAFLAEYARSADPVKAARFACAAASLSVETVGAVASIPAQNAILARMQQGNQS